MCSSINKQLINKLFILETKMEGTVTQICYLGIQLTMFIISSMSLHRENYFPSFDIPTVVYPLLSEVNCERNLC